MEGILRGCDGIIFLTSYISPIWGAGALKSFFLKGLQVGRVLAPSIEWVTRGRILSDSPNFGG